MNRLRKINVRAIKTTVESRSFGKDHDRENGDKNEMIEEENEEPLSPTGRMFHEDDFNFHILAIIGIKIKIDSSVIKANLPHTLLKHPRFSSLLVGDEQSGAGIMKWVRTNVNLEEHIILPEIDIDKEDTDSADKFVEDYIHNLTKTRVDTSKPLWELHILNVKTSMSESVAIFRIHHSLGDGVSLMSLLLACMRKTSDPNALPTLPTTTITDRKASLGRSLLGFWWGLKLIWNTFVDVMLFVATALFTLKDSKTPIKGPPNNDHNSPRRVVFGFMSLDDMKLVKNAMNMTVNDVALGITQAGLSKYLNRRYAIESKNDKGMTQKKNNLPKNIRMRSMLIFNIRPSPGIQALADMMEKNTKAKWGNSFGFALLPFTIGLRDDPLDYARDAKAVVDRKKHSLESIFSSFTIGLVYKFFGVKCASSFFRRIFINTTSAFSNVVGPIEEVGFYGHPMAYLAATTYGQANEIMVDWQSYINKMTIVLSVDENAIPDPHQLRDDIVESLKLIKDAVIEKGFDA